MLTVRRYAIYCRYRMDRLVRIGEIHEVIPMTTAELEQEVAEIKARLRRLEKTIKQIKRTQPTPPEADIDREELLAWLRDQGAIREPTDEERRLAAKWDELPEEEKEAHKRLMDSLVLDPPLSEIIIQNRR